MNHPAHQYDIFIHTILSMQLVEEPILKLTLLLHDIGKPQSIHFDEKGITRFWNHNYKSVELAKPILERLSINDKDINLILTLIEYHDTAIDTIQKRDDFINKFDEETLDLLLKIQKADLLTHASWYIEKRWPVFKKSVELAHEKSNQI